MFTCGFFNSVSGDRKYNSKQISQMFDGLITDGVIANYGTHFAVTPVSGMQINIGSGRCWFKHVWGLNDGNTTVTLSPADISANRIDAIVIEINSDDTVRNGFIKVIPGVVGGAKPSMINTETFHQHPLAYVTVNAGVTSITASNIQVVVGTSECPFATGILQAASVDNLFQQWDGQFTDWFTDLQTQMSGNVATNLQNQINGLNTNIETIQNELPLKLDLSVFDSYGRVENIVTRRLELNDAAINTIILPKNPGEYFMISCNVECYPNPSSGTGKVLPNGMFIWVFNSLNMHIPKTSNHLIRGISMAFPQSDKGILIYPEDSSTGSSSKVVWNGGLSKESPAISVKLNFSSSENLYPMICDVSIFGILK